jgi:hypothetical protein
MIDLPQRSEPYEIALPYGLSVTVKPLTTAGMAAAQAAARRAVEAIERQARERTEAGLALDGLSELSAEAERDGFYQAQLIREVAVRHITSWTGVQLEGSPARRTPDNIAAAMELYPVGERFFQEFTLRQVLLNAAKNAFGPSAAGTSSRAEGPITAEPVGTTAWPGPEVNRESTDGSAPSREHALMSSRSTRRGTCCSPARGNCGSPRAGHVIGIDVSAALNLGAARGYDVAVLSEHLDNKRTAVVITAALKLPSLESSCRHITGM